MNWWRNKDSSDDENERRIKKTLLVGIIVMVIGLTVLFFFTGCSSRVVEPWDCKCDCQKSKFECRGTTIQIDTKDIN